MSTDSLSGFRPSVVLVHGGFVDGSGWRGVYDHLKDDGNDVEQSSTNATSQSPRA